MKFVKTFSSFKYCLNFNNSTKDMWKMALRDPAYLVLLSWLFVTLIGIVFLVTQGYLQ